MTIFNSCNKKHELDKKSIKITKLNSQKISNEKIFVDEILCDSVYKNKNFKIVLKTFSDEKSYDVIDKNTVFTLNKKMNGKYQEIFRDSIESHVGKCEFRDFNGDNIKDILIQNISDVRSNWTYNLYLINLKKNKLTKIKGFGEIKNPNYLSKYDLIDNVVMSGREWTVFYQIKKDTVFHFGFILYNGEDDKGNKIDFEKEYQKTLSKVLKNKNYKRKYNN